MVSSVSRNWVDANGDYQPQLSELGPPSNTNFGTLVPGTVHSDDVTHGWSARPYSWQGSVSVQQELGSGIALSIGYFRTWYGNFTVTDNLAVTPGDYSPYCITAPADSRLPDSISGQQICGLADISPAKFGQQNNLVVHAENFGDQRDVWHGLDFTFTARLGAGRFIQGGVATGRRTTDRCFVVDSPQELYNCRVATPWSSGTQFKLSGIMPLPYAFRASAVLQNLPPINTQASYVVPNAQIAPSLGRNLGSCGTRVPCNGQATIPLIPANTFFTEPRSTQVDLRISRIFRVNRLTVEPDIGMYNLFNAASVLSMNQTYNPTWQRVTSLLAPRLVKFGVQVNF